MVERLGKYNPLRTCPVKVKFGNKSDVDHLLKNKKRLPRDIFIDKEYSKTTEKERRHLRPILKPARKIEKYKANVEWKVLMCVIDRKHYHRQNLHTLLSGLNKFDVTSDSIHSATSTPASSIAMGRNLIVQNNTFTGKRLHSSMTYQP